MPAIGPWQYATPPDGANAGSGTPPQTIAKIDGICARFRHPDAAGMEAECLGKTCPAVVDDIIAGHRKRQQCRTYGDAQPAALDAFLQKCLTQILEAERDILRPRRSILHLCLTIGIRIASHAQFNGMNVMTGRFARPTGENVITASMWFHIGANMVSMEDTDTTYGFNYGFAKLWNVSDSVEGFGIGACMNFNFNQLDGNSDSDYTYGADASLLVGYDFTKNGMPVKIKAGAGYDFEVVTSDSYYSGIIYTAGVGYDFTRKYGMEVVYKTGDMKLHTAAGDSPAFNTSTVSLNFVWRH